MHIRTYQCMSALAFAFAMPLCHADDAPPVQGPQEDASLCAMRPPVSQARAPADQFGAMTMVAADKLDAYRGGTDTIVNDTKLNGTVSGNTAINVTTGGNFIGGGSFANASGVPIVIQNTGANVLIQNATVVNLVMN
jgi:hypothetical protein